MALLRCCVLPAAVLALIAGVARAQSMGSAFNYQGRLESAGAAANGPHDLRFSLWSSPTGGLEQASSVTVLNQGVVNGLFTTPIDFGSVYFTSADKYLQIEVRPAGAGSYTVLTPRQKLGAVPYAAGLVAPFTMRNTGLETPFTVDANLAGVSGMVVSNGSGPGITVTGSQIGLKATATYGTGVYAVHEGTFTGQPAVQGDANGNFFVTTGILGRLTASTVPSGSSAVRGQIVGTGAGGAGVWGSQAGTGWGVYGETDGAGIGVVGESVGSGGIAVWGNAVSGAQAGRFSGSVQVIGTLSKSGGSFQIDHPLDPGNKYLSHSFVESPDMMNIYNGNVRTGDDGTATVELPGWFEALNRDFRYQLTVIDESDSPEFVQAKVVAGVRGNRFSIRTSAPRTTVSWQVTGVRQDVWANAHRIPVEHDKPAKERGTYLHPELHGQPASASVDAVIERAVPR